MEIIKLIKKFFRIPLFTTKKYGEEEKFYILNIPIAEQKIGGNFDYKRNRIKILGIKFSYKTKKWIQNATKYNIEENIKNINLYNTDTQNKNMLFVSSNFINVGGIETRIKQYIEGLEENGWNVFLLSENNKNQYLLTKKNFHLKFDAANFSDCLTELVRHYHINCVEFQFKNSKFLKNIDLINLKKYTKIGCTIHNLGVKNFHLINLLNYSIIVSNYLYQNHYKKIKNAIVIPNSIKINNTQEWQYSKQTNAILISRIAKEKLSSIECFIKYCKSKNIDFKIAGAPSQIEDNISYLVKKYKLSRAIFLGPVETKQFLNKNLEKILFVGGVGLVILECASLGIPAFCCSDWAGEHYSFVTRDNIDLFDNFTIRKNSLVETFGKKEFELNLTKLKKYYVKDYLKEKRNIEKCVQNYLNLLEGSYV